MKLISIGEMAGGMTERLQGCIKLVFKDHRNVNINLQTEGYQIQSLSDFVTTMGQGPSSHRIQKGYCIKIGQRELAKQSQKASHRIR